MNAAQQPGAAVAAAILTTIHVAAGDHATFSAAGIALLAAAIIAAFVMPRADTPTDAAPTGGEVRANHPDQ